MRKTQDTPPGPLDGSPFPGDIETALAASPRPRRAVSTTFLAAAVLLAVGFLGGVQAQQRWGAQEQGSAARPGGALAGNGGGSPAGRGAFARNGGSPNGGAGVTTGTVRLVSGRTVYLQTPDGTTVPVETAAGTTIQVSTAGKITDLRPGASVVVRGTAGATGKVTATSITAGPAAAAPGRGNGAGG
ncbi:hypothetical protein DPM19_13870 [Actinomadura craniellae]|uniref:DUF5666 domain-containing protein n=1 Tax=Actinomadura craniellae TaxID=2231787 RepID=A0A365H6V8_9ACTN|nr:hypothetical protein [Actinomadura craniellae]RAY14811.1 hypothetical protein DPM19_13870 [Actinomadura craniellae]